MTLKKHTHTQPLPAAFYTVQLATFFFALGLTVMIPILPLFITDELGAAEHWIGTATMTIALTAVIMRIPGGTLSDRYGRRKLMLIGGAFSLAATVIYVFATGIGVFLIARVLSGIGLALFTTTGKALSADLAPPERRGEAMGITNAAFSLAQVISPLLSEGLKNAVSFRAVFIVSTVLILVTLGITLTLRVEKPDRSDSRGARGDIAGMLRERGIWASIVLILAVAAVMATLFTFYPLMADRKNLYHDAPGLLSSVAMGMGLSIWALIDTVIEPIAGRISDRLGRLIIAAPGLVFLAAGVIAFSRASDTLSAYTAIALMTVGWGMVRAIADALAQDMVAPALRGMAAAILYTSFDLVVGLTAQSFSHLIDGADFSRMFAVLTPLVIVTGSVGLLLAVRLTTHDQRVAQLVQPAVPTIPPLVGD
ncbi:MAG: MFS transporter [Anaerolineae bacterium]|nr:MFS transporter [Anaerolineae bacterium]